MTKTADIRRTFLDFFKNQPDNLDHTIVPSSPLVPRNDPTLMFTAAGMVQFKDIFTGKEKKSYARAATAQKCLRAGGKHNDLDNVGYTARHHTFFEMLGNFSFGDYFKAEAIDMAWNLVTKEFGLAKSKLLVTVHSSDKEAPDLWKKIAGLPASKIITIPTDDNFWSMGDTGPCGPCSEIFYDHGDKIPGGPPGSADADGDRFIEIWNLVFMQFEKMEGGKQVTLPKPSIDTGMGLERISTILQGVHNNYDIDIFKTLIAFLSDTIKVKITPEIRPSFNVIADHVRACSFLIADGVLPSNEGRGYVLRRILRRAARHAHILGAKEPLLYKAVPTLINLMGEVYGELKRAEALITETLKLEETRFRETLVKGLKLLEEEAAVIGKSGKTFPGDVAFKLYDTYGFPFDLTQDALRQKNIAVDEKGFQKSMDEQKARARAAWSGSGDAATEQLWFDLKDRLGSTEFLGYDTDVAQSKILSIIVNGKEVYQLDAGIEGILITNQTPFYGESGGQVGDTGEIAGPDGQIFHVTDTQKKVGNLFLHSGKADKNATFKVGDDIDMRVASDQRNRTRANHSATHLLHEALHNYVGKHVTQKGSMVGPDRLRFDISHSKALSDDELKKVEREVNDYIRMNTEVTTVLSTPDEAIKHGAMALFGEKYGDEVRVVMMGSATDAAKSAYSIELCGGTHVKRTGDIGAFKIIGDSALAAGVRRIEALTGQGLIDYVDGQLTILDAVAKDLNVPATDVEARIKNLIADRKKLEKEVSDLRKQLAMGGGASAPEAVKEVNGIKLIAKVVSDIPAKDLKGMADEFKKNLGSGVVSLISVVDGKANLVVAVTEDLVKKINAVDLVKIGAEALGGSGGGGRPDMAQAGGPDGSKADAALKAIAEKIAA